MSIQPARSSAQSCTVLRVLLHARTEQSQERRVGVHHASRSNGSSKMSVEPTSATASNSSVGTSP